MFWKPLSESSVVCNYIESSFGLSYLSSKVLRAQLLVVFTRILYDSYIIHFIYICHVIIIIIIRLRTQFTTKKTNKTLLTVDFLINFLLITPPPYQKMVYFNEEKIVWIKCRFLLELLRYSPQLRQFPLQALTKVILTDWPFWGAVSRQSVPFFQFCQLFALNRYGT